MGRLIFGMLLMAFAVGCGDVSPTKSSGEIELAKPKETQEIGEFDATAGSEVVDSEVKISNPITGALEAYGPMKQQISGFAVTQAVEMFRATEGRYPKDYQEFLSRVIQANKIRLPEPGKGLEYQYDVKNHRLVVVKKQN